MGVLILSCVYSYLGKETPLDRDRQELKVSFENMYKERVARLEDQLRSQHETNSQTHKSMPDLMAGMKPERERGAGNPYDSSNSLQPKFTCLTCNRTFWFRNELFDHFEKREQTGNSHERDTTTPRRERLRRW